MRDPLALLGKPYVLHGTDPAVGFDCWTLVEYVRRECFGLATPLARGDAFELPENKFVALNRALSVIGAAQDCGAWQRVETGAPGDVVGLSLSERIPLHHVGVLLPQGVLHAWAGVGRVGIGSVILTPFARLSPLFAQVEVYTCRA